MPPRAATPTTTSDVVTASFGPETDDIDEGGHGQDRTAPAEGAEREPDEQPQGQGEEEAHTTVPGRASLGLHGQPGRGPGLHATVEVHGVEAGPDEEGGRPEPSGSPTGRPPPRVGPGAALPSSALELARGGRGGPRGRDRPATRPVPGRRGAPHPHERGCRPPSGRCPWSPPQLPSATSPRDLPASVHPFGYPVGYPSAEYTPWGTGWTAATGGMRPVLSHGGARRCTETPNRPSLAARLGTSDEPFVVDVREPVEFAAWSIPSAVNIPLGELAARARRCRPIVKWSPCAPRGAARRRRRRYSAAPGGGWPTSPAAWPGGPWSTTR